MVVLVATNRSHFTHFTITVIFIWSHKVEKQLQPGVKQLKTNQSMQFMQLSVIMIQFVVSAKIVLSINTLLMASKTEMKQHHSLFLEALQDWIYIIKSFINFLSYFCS